MARALDIALVDGVAEKIKCYANYRIIPMVSCLYGTVVTVLGCEQKSVEVEFRWLKLRVCNANYAAEQAIDAKFW